MAGLGTGQVALQRSLTVSSDWYYYWIGDNLWANNERIGDDFLQQTAADFGFTAETEIDLAAEREGLRLHTRDSWLSSTRTTPDDFPYGDWTAGNTINMSIGQGDIGVTPMQLTNAYAALANGGTLYRPHVGGAALGPRPGAEHLGAGSGDPVRGQPGRDLHRDPLPGGLTADP